MLTWVLLLNLMKSVIFTIFLQLQVISNRKNSALICRGCLKWSWWTRQSNWWRVKKTESAVSIGSFLARRGIAECCFELASCHMHILYPNFTMTNISCLTGRMNGTNKQTLFCEASVGRLAASYICLRWDEIILCHSCIGHTFVKQFCFDLGPFTSLPVYTDCASHFGKTCSMTTS